MADKLRKKPAKKPQEDFEDDGRVYADMSVIDDITPSGSLFGSGRKKKVPKLDQDGYPIEEEDNSIELSKAEKKAVTKGVIRAFLIYALIGIVFISLIFIFLVCFWLQ